MRIFHKSRKAVKAIMVVPWVIHQLDESQKQDPVDYDKRKDAIEILKAYISAIGLLAGVFAGVGLFANFYNSTQDRKLNIEKMANERLVKSIEQLSSDKIYVRISGIHSLRGVAQDSEMNKDAIIATLDSFVIRHSIGNYRKSLDDLQKPSCSLIVSSPKDNDYIATAEERTVHSDVEAAIITISKLITDDKNTPTRYDRTCLDLSRMKFIQKNNLKNNDFQQSIFVDSNLSKSFLNNSLFADAIIHKSIFSGATMKEVNFASVTIKSSHFDSAHLQKAIFKGSTVSESTFKSAELNEADLSYATFSYTDFADAVFANANLDGTIFIGKRLHDKQVISSCNWEKAIFDSKDKDSLIAKYGKGSGESSRCKKWKLKQTKQ